MWGFAFCDNICPDGKVCSDRATCCRTGHGYNCCPYPKAVCCSDLTHCCPSGFQCNLATQMCEKGNQPWMNVPMVKKEAAEEPTPLDLSVTPFEEVKDNHVLDLEKSSVVHCDNYYACPDGTSCCRHLTGTWYCCAYSPAWCCRDGWHCCPYGYDCDYTFTRCVRTGLPYPFLSRQVPSSVRATRISASEDKVSQEEEEIPMTPLTEASTSPLQARVIRCDSKYFCPPGFSCCKTVTGQQNCCPFRLGQCCADGVHCCPHGLSCDATSLKCKKGFSQISSEPQVHAQLYRGPAA